MDNNVDIKFNDTWYLLYHHTLDDWTIGGYRKIFEISTMREFWEVHNNIDCIGGINNLHFFLFRKGISPIYEDKKNENGGSWSMLTSMSNAYEVWEDLAMRLVGETITSNPSSITGISINVKSDVSVLRIWNNNRHNSSISQLPKIKHIQGNILYKDHPIQRKR